MADPLTIAAAAGGIAKTIGSIFAGSGAKKRARAISGAASAGKQRVSEFTSEFTDESKALKGTKLGILGDSANVFDRLGGFIFGNTDTLDNLREAQSEFSALASGDTGGFLQEVESIVKSALAGTAGAPRGAFENLSARNLFDFRSQGLQNALSLTNTLGTLGSGLINTEFGIHDQDFNTRLRLRENEVNQLNALDMTAAGVQGTGAAATGNIFNTLGQGVFGVGNSIYAMDRLNRYEIPSLLQQQQAAVANNAYSPGAKSGVAFGSTVPLPSSSSLGGTSTPINMSAGPPAYDAAAPYGRLGDIIPFPSLSPFGIPQLIDAVDLLPPTGLLPQKGAL